MNRLKPGQRLTRRRMLAGTLGSAVLLGLAACGVSDDDEEPGGETGAAATPTPADTDAEPTRESTASPTSAASPTPEAPTPTATAEEVQEEEAEEPRLGPDGHFAEVQVADDGTKHLIPLNRVQSGGPPKDGVPSLDDPEFVGPDRWDEMGYQDDGFVIGVEVNGGRRAYPFQVLVWHEIANDVLEGLPLLVSYCPLCGSAIVFVREVEGEPVEFGVSGKLYNSDLLMYDRRTDTLWSQITGTAVVGELTGDQLEIYPSQLMTWADWKSAYPDSEVLALPRSFGRDYTRNPYAGYDEDTSIWFGVTDTDDRLHPKERISGIEIDEQTFGAYPDADVREHGPVNDVLGDVPLLVAADPNAGGNVVAFDRRVDGRTLTFEADGDMLVDTETGSRWNYAGEAVEGELAGAKLDEVPPIKGFWFAWYAFHQDTELWQPGR